MAMVGVDSGTLQTDSQPESFGLDSGSAAAWTWWTLATVLSWW